MLRRLIAIFMTVVLCLGCCACAQQDTPKATGGGNGPTQSTNQQPQDQTVTPPAVQTPDPNEVFTDRDRETGYQNAVTVTLSDKGSAASGNGIAINGSTVTITAEGTYVLTGTLTDGQIRVNVADQQKVQLVLSGVSVKCKGGAALFIAQGDKVFVTLAEGTENTLASTGKFIRDTASGVDAVVYSKADLTFNGSGTLTVRSEEGHGIVSKDDLKFTGGSYVVEAEKQGISGKDCLCIENGSFTVNSGTDGIRSKNDEDTTRGYVYIFGGTFDITAGNDGVDASKDLAITGGEFTVVTGDGSASVTHSDGEWGGGMPGGWWGSGDSSQTATDESRKGLKATGITITGGSFNVDAEDDAIHSNDALTVAGGTFTVATGDDAFHAESTLAILDGTIGITKSYEGLEGSYITVFGGNIQLIASDDGMNAAGGNDGSGMAGPWGQGGFAETTDACITISGGTIILNAGGDGIDSNGDLTVTGGAVYLDGPTNSGNGPLDYAGNAKITGGTFIALGAAGMAMNFGTDSTQGAILCGLNGTAPAGTAVSIKDSAGNVLASYTSQKTFQSILISAPGMAVGETYTVFVGEASGEFTLDSIIYGSGSGMGGGMGGGRPGR